MGKPKAKPAAKTGDAFFQDVPDPPKAPTGAPAANPVRPGAAAAPTRRAQQAQAKASTVAPAGLRPTRVQTKVKAVTADTTIAMDAQGVDRKALAADIERIRKTRKPFGSMTQKLAYPPIPGYHIHWFSDDPGRVDEAENNGWAFVKDKTGQQVKRVVGRGRDGKALYGFLMKLPEIFWQEDMAAKHDAAQARIDEIKKRPIRAKPGTATAADRGKFYDPHEEGGGIVQVSESLVRSQPRA